MEVSNSLSQKMYSKAFQGFKQFSSVGFNSLCKLNILIAIIWRRVAAQEIVWLEKMQSYPVHYPKIYNGVQSVLKDLFRLPKFEICSVVNAGVSYLGHAAGMPWHSQILADQLTLSQPRGADYAHQMILVPPDFQTFLQPWNNHS